MSLTKNLDMLDDNIKNNKYVNTLERPKKPEGYKKDNYVFYSFYFASFFLFKVNTKVITWLEVILNIDLNYEEENLFYISTITCY